MLCFGTVSFKGWDVLTDIVCFDAVHFTANCLSPVILWMGMNLEVMIVGSEQGISHPILACAIAIPVPALLVASAIAAANAIVLLAMVATMSHPLLLLEAAQSCE